MCCSSISGARASTSSISIRRSAGAFPATDADGDGDLDVDVNLKVPEPRRDGVTVGPDGVTVNCGDTSAKVRAGEDPAVSVATNRN